ncbi:hypothetical protein BCR36DRAFT_6175 [Piromyces finnis]|uniref:Uncharacterized protein n=1 Tax=Piromyces finnis TaxID=1754191 RepID=A0A1Y1VP68_9FUNG|nr:hypothetical protein BCR36DRAFT_6175 [Piromyces finnis]|eukprot:ORX61060.1 hypothetical protein BCR36DRAFT_6175 [Piromyces finnis]
MYSDIRFFITHNDTKKQTFINKHDLTKEIEYALSCSSANNIYNSHNKLLIPLKAISLSKLKNTTFSYNKTNNNGIEDNTFICNDSSISFNNKVNVKSIALNQAEDITFFVSNNKNNNLLNERSYEKQKNEVVKKLKYLNTSSFMKKYNLFNGENNYSNDKKINEKEETFANDSCIKKIIIANENEKNKNKDKININTNKEKFDEMGSVDEDVLSTHPNINAACACTSICPEEKNGKKDDSIECEKKENKGNNYEEKKPVIKMENSIPIYSKEKFDIDEEEMILELVANDEKEKTRLQQIIIDQNLQHLSEKQKEVDRLNKEIVQQKAKIEEHRSHHIHLSQELELKRRQSAELRTKLISQFEKNQQQLNELNYYKKMNYKYMEINRQLQKQIRELAKLKYLK